MLYPRVFILILLLHTIPKEQQIMDKPSISPHNDWTTEISVSVTYHPIHYYKEKIWFEHLNCQYSLAFKLLSCQKWFPFTWFSSCPERWKIGCMEVVYSGCTGRYPPQVPTVNIYHCHTWLWQLKKTIWMQCPGLLNKRSLPWCCNKTCKSVPLRMSYSATIQLRPCA